ncbi:unnamed protein product, partial [Urochloa humidicola]
GRGRAAAPLPPAHAARARPAAWRRSDEEAAARAPSAADPRRHAEKEAGRRRPARTGSIRIGEDERGRRCPSIALGSR